MNERRPCGGREKECRDRKARAAEAGMTKGAIKSTQHHKGTMPFPYGQQEAVERIAANLECKQRMVGGRVGAH